MKLPVHEAARIIRAEVTGDGAFIIEGVSSFDDACSSDITFAGDSGYLNRLELTRAKTIIVPKDYTPEKDKATDKIILRVSNPRISFFKIVSLFHPELPSKTYIHPDIKIEDNVIIGGEPHIEANVFIGSGTVIGSNVHLMPGVYIGRECVIGDNCVIKPNVTLMERTKLGSHVIIHPGSVIGSDGFGFAQNDEKHEKLVHTGYVSIGSHVEIGACNTIDRGTLGVTRIGNGVKTDNQVHIAHNVKIGDNTLLVAQVGIAGSTTIGKNVIIAGKSGITGHIHIGDNTIVGPYSGVYTDVPDDQIVSGVPHMPHKKWLQMGRILSRLPELRKKLLSFDKRIKVLENKKNKTE